MNTYITKKMKDEQGIALVLVLVSMFILAIFAGSILLSSKSNFIKHAHKVNHSRALEVAEAGVEKGLWQLNQNLSWDGESSELSDVDGEKIGEFVVSVLPVPGHSDKAIIRSTGYVPGISDDLLYVEERTVQIIVKKAQISGAPFDKAIYTPTIVDDNGITTIDGDVAAGEGVYTTPNVAFEDRLGDHVYYDEEEPPYSSPNTRPAVVDYNLNLDDDPTNDVILPFDQYMLDQFKALSQAQGNYFDHEPTRAELDNLPTDFYQPDGVTPNIIFINSTIHISGNYTLGGFIVVVGEVISEEEDAAFGGSDLIEGVVYTTGEFRTHGGGNKEININGGVLCGSALMQGHANVTYHQPYMDSIRNLATSLNIYRFESWHEILPNS